MKPWFIIAAALLCSSVFGQVRPHADTLSTVSILTDPSGADVFVDSVYVGKSPLQQIAIQTGSHQIRAFYPSMFAWNAVLTRDSLAVSEGEHLEKRLVVGAVMRVQSDPPNGSVVYDGSPLGATPLYLRSSAPLSGSLTIQKDGYDSLRVPLIENIDGLMRVQLRPRAGRVEPSSPNGLLGLGEKAKDRWIAYASGASMIVSGVASAYIKGRANREFDNYLLTKDPASLSRTRRFDRGAAACLVLSQISFAILSYVLLSE